jgi:hypothetical protein
VVRGEKAVTVSREWSIDFAEAAELRTRDGSLDRVLARPGGRGHWEGALADLRELAAPAAVWELVPVEEFCHGTVVLRGGARLAGGPIADVVAGAHELALAVCTVGEAITERIRDHQHEGRLLRGVLLDELASMTVDSVRQQVCRRLSAEAEAAGLRASVSLSPGESEWPLSDQAVIFSLVDAAAIGVSLAPTLLMRPLKSLSLVLGRGGRGTPSGGDGCDYCVIRERCEWRGRRRAPAEGMRRAPAQGMRRAPAEGMRRETGKRTEAT